MTVEIQQGFNSIQLDSTEFNSIFFIHLDSPRFNSIQLVALAALSHQVYHTIRYRLSPATTTTHYNYYLTMPPKPTPWGKSKAKKLLREDIIAGVVKPDDKAEDVFKTRPEFQLYVFKNFKTNLKNLRQAIATGVAVKTPPWRNSKAKALLREDIITGFVKTKDSAEAVYAMRPEFQDFKLKNFTTNLKSLQLAIAKDHKRMQIDCEYYGHDRALLKELRKNDPPIENDWFHSEARQLLKQDIDEGKHTRMKPSILYLEHPEYQDFAPDVFRKHIHQEVDERDSRAFRFAKKSLRQRGPAPTNVLINIHDDD